MATAKDIPAATEFVDFMNKCPSPFHVVDEVKQMLNGVGFSELKGDSWNFQPAGKYYATRNNSSIIAFVLGQKYIPGSGFSIIGAHTDSPCLKVKPVSQVTKSGYQQVGVECYGGGIWSTWFDRDLTAAGKVMVRNQAQKIEQRLVNLKDPIMRIPNIAIHLQRDINEKLTFNKETHLCPILATAATNELSGVPSTDTAGPTEADHHHSALTKLICDKLAITADAIIDLELYLAYTRTFILADHHHSALTKLISDNLSITSDAIIDLELYLADTQPATLGGAHKEFIFSPRLDNLLSVFSAAKALSENCDNVQNEEFVRMICLFDNEEVGSVSNQGADSKFLEHVIRRIADSATNSVAYEQAINKSVFLSSDCAHAVHPNFSDKHESNHQPSLHGGLVIKQNANQRYATTAETRTMIRLIAEKASVPLQHRYATTAETRTMIRLIAEKASVPLQDFVVRNDMPCGSTIGPIVSANIGVRTVDIGAPQLSMHSIRETCGSSSVANNNKMFAAFFQYLPEVQASFV